MQFLPEAVLQALEEGKVDYAVALMEDAREADLQRELSTAIVKALAAAKKGRTEEAKKLLNAAFETISPAEETPAEEAPVVEAEEAPAEEEKEEETTEESEDCPCEGDECPYEHTDEAVTTEAVVGELISEAEAGSIVERLGDSNSYKVTLIESGISKNRNYWSPSVLERAARMFEGSRAFADHPTRSEMADRPERSIKDIIGWYESAKWTPSPTGGRVSATMHLLDGPVAKMVQEAHARGKPDLIQLSVNISGRRQPKSVNGVMTREVVEIHRVHSVDAVTEASAGGSIDQIAASANISKEVEELMALDNISSEDLAAMLEGRTDLQEFLQERFATKAEADQSQEDTTTEAQTDSVQTDALAAVTAQLEEIRRERALDQAERKLEKTLAESNLPEPIQSKLRKRYSNRVFEISELQSDIEDERSTLQQLRLARVPEKVEWSTDAGDATSETDRHMKAMEGLIAGKSIDGIRPFHNLRHAYYEITGKNPFDQTGYEVLESARGYDSGIGNSDVGNISEATSMVTTQFTKILGDSITRRALEEYRFPALQEWKRISNVVPVSDLRDQKRERLGEFHLLKRETSVTNGEQVTYADLTGQPLPEEEAHYQPYKAHGMAALTLEMIINDDIGKLRKIPVALGRSASGLIYVTVFDFLMNNVAESTYLTGAAGGPRLISQEATRSPSNLVNNVYNYDATPVALNDANLSDAKKRFRTMQAATSSTTPFPSARKHSFILAEPKLLIVAPENEAAAIALRDSPSKVATNTHEVNIHKGSFDLLVLPYWQTEAAFAVATKTLSPKNIWYLVASPDQLPMIEVGFLNGREEPEIFVQDQETVGDRFNKDVTTYKVRHFWGANPMDHRGFVAAHVTA